MRANLRHSYKENVDVGKWNKKEDWPRNAKGAYKQDHGKIPQTMPEVTKFLADKAHCKKTLGKALYSAMSSNRHLKMYNSDCERLKTGFAYAAGASTGKTFDQFSLDMQAPLYHHFNDHQFCGDWCNYHVEPVTEEERET